MKPFINLHETVFAVLECFSTTERGGGGDRTRHVNARSQSSTDWFE
jgi:hypothetical protein